MPRDNRMSRMLHVLIHMDRHLNRATSEAIATMLGTNAVVVRRMMAGLRQSGAVTAEKGHGGGWELACKLDEITLLDVYRAIGEPSLFNIGAQSDRPDCLVEQAVDARMADALLEAEKVLIARFAQTSVADLAEDFEKHLAVHAQDGNAPYAPPDLGEQQGDFKP